MREAFLAAWTGRYERLLWLADRWPALMDHGWGYEEGTEGEGVLHQACRAAAYRCVQLCLRREVSSFAM